MTKQFLIRPPFDFETLCKIEDTVHRAYHAVRQLGVRDEIDAHLDAAERVLAEIRFAALYLCADGDRGVTDETRRQVVERLLDLFAKE